MNNPFYHFLVAFLPLIVYTLVRYRRPPTGAAILVLLFATQLPDLIDKPLAWTFDVIPSGEGDSTVADSATVDGAELEENVAVMDGATVQDSTLRDTVVFPHATIDDSDIERSVVDEHASVLNTDLDGALVGPHTKIRSRPSDGS